MNDRMQRVRRYLKMPVYLKELAVLVGRPVREEELSSLEQMESVRRKPGSIPKECYSIEIPFAAKSDQKFEKYTKQLTTLNPAPLYIWTDRSNDCGLLKVNSLSQIVFSFPFDLNMDGIISIVTSDLADSMVLDWSEEYGKKILVVETHGIQWSKAKIDLSNYPT